MDKNIDPTIDSVTDNKSLYDYLKNCRRCKVYKLYREHLLKAIKMPEFKEFFSYDTLISLVAAATTSESEDDPFEKMNKELTMPMLRKTKNVGMNNMKL